jgi:hypothetical protein
MRQFKGSIVQTFNVTMPRSDRSSGSIAFTLRSGRLRSREIANTRRKVGQEEPQVLPCHIDRFVCSISHANLERNDYR